MNFGRLLEGKRAPEPMSQINVTPLVDVMLVLLVIFMVTAPFFSGSLKLDLPRAPVSAAPPSAAPSLLLELGGDGQLRLNGLAVTDAQLSQRLREVAEREGARSWLIQRAAEIDWAWFDGVTTVGLTAGASAPEVLVQEVLAAMSERFSVSTENITTAVEEVVFKLPRSLTA